VHDQVELPLQLENEPLAKAVYTDDCAAQRLLGRGRGCPQEEGMPQPERLEYLPLHARSQRFQVRFYVW
jgi:hypothetical protein